jgi:YbbR domain-containing protein
MVQQKNKKYSKIKKMLRSKSLIGSLIFAMALWGYTTLSGEFTSFIEVPLKVILPGDRAIENPLPQNISVSVRGSGWQLFSLTFFNSSAQCLIDLSKRNIQDSTFKIARADIIKSVRYLLNLEAIDVIPDNLNLTLGRIGIIRVPVRPIIDINTKTGFLQVGKIDVQPDSIYIRGNEKVIGNIKEWKTQFKRFDAVHESFTASIPLSSDTLNTLVSLSTSNVTISADVQQAAEITIPDVKIQIRGGVLPVSQNIKPRLLSVTLRGGINQISSVNPDAITASIQFNQILRDSTGILKPDIDFPEGLILLNTDPPYIYHIREALSWNYILHP